MLKSISVLIVCLCLMFTFSMPAFAANEVNTIDIEAILYQDGSMYITQVWEGDFDEGTESYIPMNAPDYLTISELTVSDQNGSYETLPDWNIDWSFEEKAKKCGIHTTGNGYEICSMAPQISQFIMNRQMTRALDRLDDGEVNGSASMQFFDIPEPFHAFNVELYFDHPYWTVIKCDMDGPQFNNTHPDVNDYLRDYQRSIEELEKLVAALKTVAFPEAPEQSIGFGTAQAVHTAAAPPVDVIEEIKKYKALMDDGIISQQEFDAKKKQLLGI